MTGANVLKFCPRCGSPHFAPRTANHLVCTACSFQWFLNPVAGAACFIFDAQDRVLLIRREKDPGKGRLAPPGGFIDLGETAEAGLRREVHEETGLSIGDLTFLCSHPNTYAYGGYTYAVLDLFFTARVATFAGLKQGDDVVELVTPAARDVRAEELAFLSMQQAWRELLRGPVKFIPS
ncbi:MAG: NUDIX domain-containing protein [Opitutae bacterium]